MRLRVSRNAAEEQLSRLLEEGHRLQAAVHDEFTAKSLAGSFLPSNDVPYFQRIFSNWCSIVSAELAQIFPSAMESAYFLEPKIYMPVVLEGMDRTYSILYYQEMPDKFSRLREIIFSHIVRYTDLPVKDRLFVEDIDSFGKVRDVNPAMVSHHLNRGFLSMSENQVQLSLEQILNVSFHRNDWGGEINDLYTANVVVNGARRPTAFLLKGPGIGRKEMEIADCGKRGDQIVRLFTTPADLFVVQYVGPISDNLVKDVEGKTATARASGNAAHFLIIDGQDTARLLHAYGKM
jgi:hypothetical protein